jgi:hypothetical protein
MGFRYTEKEESGEWRKFHTNELKSMRWAEYVERMGEVHTEVRPGMQKAKNHLEDLDADDRQIFKNNLK